MVVCVVSPHYHKEEMNGNIKTRAVHAGSQEHPTIVNNIHLTCVFDVTPL